MGIHGVARAREWDAVTTVDAELPGEACGFVVLADGELLLEEGEADPAPLVAALARSVAPPYRARGVRRDEGTWAVAARRLRVVEVPDAPGAEIRVTVTREGRQVEVDGMPTFGGVPVLEQLLGRAEGVVSARRLRGSSFEIRVDLL